MKLTVTIDLDDRRWFTLAGRADAMGTKVADILEAEVRAAVSRLTTDEHPAPPEPEDHRGPNPYRTSRPYADELRREICRRMWVGGHSSLAIAARLGTRNVWKVRATLWDLGFDTRSKIGRPPAGDRPRPVHITKELAS